MESDYSWLVTVGLVTSSVIAVTANSFLLAVFCRRRGLRTVPNRFVINLLITNLLSSILLIPLLLTNQETTTLQTEQSNETLQVVFTEEILSATKSANMEIIQEKVVEEERKIQFDDADRLVLCYFAQGATSFMCTLSIFSILLIGINQYFGVMHSLRYHVYINKCRSTLFIASTWLAALICAVFNSLTFSDSTLWHFCKKPSPSNELVKVFSTVYAFLYFLLIILAPFVAICVIYMCIYTAAHQNSERMRKSNSSSCSTPLEYTQVPLEQRESLPKVHSAPNFTHLQIQNSYVEVTSENSVQVKRSSSERSTNNFITNLKHKLSNASVFRYREETRAAKISVLVIFMVLICYLPYGLTLILSSDCIGVHPGQIFNYLSLVLLVLSNIISPFLFGYRNKRVKREIGKMFGLISSSSSKLPNPERCKRTIVNKSFDNINETFENNQPFLANVVVPKVIVTCKQENEKERKSILKRVCNSSTWNSYKKCNFITVPDSCLGEARGSFSSASTQISTEE